MSDLLIRIKRLVLAGDYVISEKARVEMEADGLEELDAVEAITNAVTIHKTLRSNVSRGRPEYLHVIVGTNFEGVAIYTKGKIVRERRREVFYFLVSSKRAL